MMTDAQRTRLEAMTMVGQSVMFKYKGKSSKYQMGKVEEEVFILVDDYKHMIQRIRFADGVSWDGSTFGYRTGYYTYQADMKQIKWGSSPNS